MCDLTHGVACHYFHDMNEVKYTILRNFSADFRCILRAVTWLWLTHIYPYILVISVDWAVYLESRLRKLSTADLDRSVRHMVYILRIQDESADGCKSASTCHSKQILTSTQYSWLIYVKTFKHPRKLSKWIHHVTTQFTLSLSHMGWKNTIKYEKRVWSSVTKST